MIFKINRIRSKIYLRLTSITLKLLLQTFLRKLMKEERIAKSPSNHKITCPHIKVWWISFQVKWLRASVSRLITIWTTSNSLNTLMKSILAKLLLRVSLKHWYGLDGMKKYRKFSFFKSSMGSHCFKKSWRESEFKEQGVGLVFYFKFQKYLSIVFLCLSILSIPSYLLYSQGGNYQRNINT